MKKILILIMATLSVATEVVAQEHRVITSDQIKWGLLNPARGKDSPKAADLWGDRTKNTATGMLVRFEEGFNSPPHIHNITYRGVVIEGLVHNDDPNAAQMWLPKGSFWVQPAGENHTTAANAKANLVYIEIDSGPYLVEPSSEAFDNGERPINIDSTNLVWVTAKDAEWIDIDDGKIAFLWGATDSDNGTFLKLPANFKGYIEDNSSLKVVVVEGNFKYRYGKEGKEYRLSPSAFFSSDGDAKHYLQGDDKEILLYVRNIGGYHVK